MQSAYVLPGCLPIYCLITASCTKRNSSQLQAAERGRGGCSWAVRMSVMFANCVSSQDCKDTACQDYSALLITFSKRCRNAVAQLFPDAHVSTAADMASSHLTHIRQFLHGMRLVVRVALPTRLCAACESQLELASLTSGKPFGSVQARSTKHSASATLLMTTRTPTCVLAKQLAVHCAHLAT